MRLILAASCALLIAGTTAQADENPISGLFHGVTDFFSPAPPPPPPPPDFPPPEAAAPAPAPKAHKHKSAKAHAAKPAADAAQ